MNNFACSQYDHVGFSAVYHSKDRAVSFAYRVSIYYTRRFGLQPTLNHLNFRITVCQ